MYGVCVRFMHCRETSPLGGRVFSTGSASALCIAASPLHWADPFFIASASDLCTVAESPSLGGRVFCEACVSARGIIAIHPRSLFCHESRPLGEPQIYHVIDISSGSGFPKYVWTSRCELWSTSRPKASTPPYLSDNFPHRVVRTSNSHFSHPHHYIVKYFAPRAIYFIIPLKS